MMEFTDVYANGKPTPHAVLFLYSLMKEREAETNISHKKLPTMREHLAFVNSQPYRYWYLIGSSLETGWYGYISATNQNELGIIVKKQFQRKGIGSRAVKLFMSTIAPLPEIPGQRRGCWLANISPLNEPSMKMFHELGFRLIQHTYAFEDLHAKTENKTRQA
jgi:RimJ/RimL family protein N-acetyltransferase